jgi:SH3-like domain-containing protein
MRKILIFSVTLFIALILNSYAFALCVNVPVANLRSGPGTNYQKTWQVYKYMPFKKIGSKGNWYKVRDVDGDEHWIYKKLVTSRIKCAVVKKEKVNVRSGPGRKYSKNSLSPVVKYDSFKVLKIRKSWVKVLDEYGDTGWIFRKLLWIQ